MYDNAKRQLVITVQNFFAVTSIHEIGHLKEAVIHLDFQNFHDRTSVSSTGLTTR